MDGIDILERALADHGIALKKFTEASQEREKKANERSESLSARLQAIEQKLDGKAPAGALGAGADELADLLSKSDALAAYRKGQTRAIEIEVPRALLMKAAILSPYPVSNDQPVVAPDRSTGIVPPAVRRFMIRDLLPQVTTTSNLVEFTQEQSFTNNAGPQFDSTSPDPHSESALKNESAITFLLANTPVVTLAHFIPASRQILDDAPALAQFINARLVYGLKLEEEDELLTGSGSNGELSGLITNATTFSGGSTNLTALGALALAIGQLIAANFAPGAIVLSPADWYSSKILLAKDTQGRYIFGDPGSAAEPRLWGIPVAVSNAMTAGHFLVMDGQRAATIYDRENATVRVAEQHSDWFARNMVAVLAEERLALAITNTAAMVYGALTFAG
jgi:HK97 family phage major capsid protein